ncbi:unnamed protein product [Periconia digitata]|uniref:Uncharacterized protein n=1 Tax=Periconia digitata TaxID=1303443 RepID=A0A9W4UQ15_9PLEO|nr:unnamed protein product [Periconia digitata]
MLLYGLQKSCNPVCLVGCVAIVLLKRARNFLVETRPRFRWTVPRALVPPAFVSTVLRYVSVPYVSSDLTSRP